MANFSPDISPSYVAFTSAEGSDYGRNDNITFSDGNYTLALDIYGEDYKYTKSGTYVVGAEDGYLSFLLLS